MRTRQILTALAAVGALALGGCGAAEAKPQAQSAPTRPAAPSSAAPSPSAALLPGETPAGSQPPVLNNGPRTTTKVALTFDADMTDAMLQALATGKNKSFANLKVLDILEQQQVPAMFFLTGKWVEHYPDVTRRIAANPRFELGNHTYGHQAFTPKCYTLPQIPPSQRTEDVDRTFKIIQGYGGRQTRYFRFPGLCHDGTALTALAPLGVTVIDGDVVSGDPFATRYQPIVDAVLSKARGGSIVVMHITEENAAMTDEALPLILDGLRRKGLQPANLTEVLRG